MGENDDINLASEVLTQSEVERLLAQVAEQETQAVIHKADGGKQQIPKDSVQTYDFRNPVYLSPNELRKLRIEHEEYMRALAARLSIYLRLEFSLQMSKLQTLTYQKFTESLTSPTYLTLFKVEPLQGVCILEIPPRLGLTIVDRLMGGPGHSVASGRDPSEIEIALLSQVVHIILGEWCNHWQNCQELRPVLLGQETNAQFLQTSLADAVMLVLGMESRLGDCLEQMHIAFPYSTIEPMVRKLSQEVANEAEQTAAAQAVKPQWNPLLAEMPIPVIAEWPAMKMTTRQLASIKQGDFLELTPEELNKVQVRLASLCKFTGRLGTRDGKWAVELNQVLKA